MNRSISTYIVLLAGALVLCLASFWLLQKTKQGAVDPDSKETTCISNLVMIQAAKARWAINNKAGGNSIPPDSILDIHSTPHYVERPLVCPQGGNYSLGSMSEMPTCSLGGEGHHL